MRCGAQMGQDRVTVREVGEEWGSLPGSPPRIPMRKETRDTRGPSSIVSPNTQSLCAAHF